MPRASIYSMDRASAVAIWERVRLLRSSLPAYCHTSRRWVVIIFK